MFEIDIKREFSAAHRLKGYKGNCAFLHGHNWTVEVTVLARKLDPVGIAVDFRRLKRELDSVLKRLDHANLSELKPFTSTNPTSELLAEHIYKNLSRRLNGKDVKVSKVRVSEAPGSGAAYFEK